MGEWRVVRAMVLACGLVGCAGGSVTEPEPTLQTRVAELAAPNGRNLNGRNLNGRNLNGTSMGPLVSVNLSGVYAADSVDDPMSSAWLQGSVFHGFNGGREVSGLDFLGARFTGNLGGGQTVELRVDAINPATGASGDIWSYRVSFRDTADGTWKPACPAADGSALDAIAVSGTWNYQEGVFGGGAHLDDPSLFTFACEGAAIAKCVHFGYRPWATAADGRSIADLHQACTRMVRADFCGDGTSHTQDGNWVNLYDAQGVQQDTESWLLEAEWNTDGALCSSSTTRSAVPVSCPNKPQLSGCGQLGHFRTGTLIMSEVPSTTP